MFIITEALMPNPELLILDKQSTEFRPKIVNVL